MCESDPLADVVGVRLVRSKKIDHHCFWFFRFESSADAGTAAAVVDSLAGNRVLQFSDPNYRSVPGAAAISAMRESETFLASASFHHSLGAWAVVSRDELVAYLTLCLRWQGPESKEPFHIRYLHGRMHLGRINRTPWASFRNTMALRLGRPTYLQERLQPYGLGLVRAQMAAFRRFWL